MSLLLQMLLCIILSQRPGQDAAWVDLFNGKDYSGFTFWIIGGPERTFVIKDNCMLIHPVPTGHLYTTDRIFKIGDKDILSRNPLVGYTYTRKQYRNYELKFEWKYQRPNNLTDDKTFTGNSGVFLHLTRVLKSWPVSIEVDGKYTDVGKIIAHGKAQVEFKDAPQARQAAIKPVGQWNETLISCNEGAIKVTVNGKLVAEGTTDQREGSIGFQAQGAAIYYRNIKVRELK